MNIRQFLRDKIGLGKDERTQNREDRKAATSWYRQFCSAARKFDREEMRKLVKSASKYACSLRRSRNGTVYQVRRDGWRRLPGRAV